MTTSMDASSAKQVFIPATVNDYGSMIYTLLEQQLSFIAAKDGADVRSACKSLTTHACTAPTCVLATVTLSGLHACAPYNNC